jgi:hypothetical protein
LPGSETVTGKSVSESDSAWEADDAVAFLHAGHLLDDLILGIDAHAGRAAAVES